MALADTARLVASLELQDKFSKTASAAEKSLGGLENKSGSAGKAMGLFGHAASTALGVGLERVAEGGIRLLTSAFTSGVEGAEKLQSVMTQTNAVLSSTKGAAGENADAIRNLASKYEDLNATIDDKVIQSAENVLLTFTNVKKQAFEPALEAALNLNQALGGGEEGLQGTMIQLGKALNDPIKGITALRRVGVAFTADQIAQIKQLVKQNDLYGAQKIILGELSKEFGGSFAKAGQTGVAQAAALADSVDDLKITFAQGLLPGINNVRSALTTTFRDPATIAAVGELGKQLGNLLTPERIQQGIGLLKTGFASLKDIPWAAIGASLKLAGTGARTLLGAFEAVPPWVQTAVLTGWGLNKLTGGVAGSIFGGIGENLAKGIAGSLGKSLFERGGTPATPLFVADVSGGIGKLAGGAAAGAGGLGVGGIVLGVGAAAAVGAALAIPLANAIRVAAGISPEDAAKQNSLGQFGPRSQSNLPTPGAASSAPLIGEHSIDRIVDAANKANSILGRGITEGHRDTDKLSTAFGRNDKTISSLRETMQSTASKQIGALVAKLGTLTKPGDITKLAGTLTHEFVDRGIGSLATGQKLLASLQQQQKAAIAAGDTQLARSLGVDIRKVEGKLPDKAFINRELRAAESTLNSTKTSAEKLKELQRIQADLKAHGDTHAAAIISAAIKQKKLSVSILNKTTNIINVSAARLHDSVVTASRYGATYGSGNAL